MAEPEECGRLGAFDVRLRMLHRPFCTAKHGVTRCTSFGAWEQRHVIVTERPTAVDFAHVRPHDSESTDALNLTLTRFFTSGGIKLSRR